MTTTLKLEETAKHTSATRNETVHMGIQDASASPESERRHIRIVRDEESKTLTERFNEAYDEEARQEDEEFVENVKRYQHKRFSDEW
jgi:hypothetical protein